MLEKNKQYKHIEDLLYQYNKTKKKIKTLESNLDNIILKKHSSIAGANDNNQDYKSDIEKIEEIKEEILKKIVNYKKLVKLTEDLLEQIRDDKYFRIIELRYLDNKKIDVIVEILEISHTTLTTQKRRLIEELAGTVFPHWLKTG